MKKETVIQNILKAWHTNKSTKSFNISKILEYDGKYIVLPENTFGETIASEYDMNTNEFKTFSIFYEWDKFSKEAKEIYPGPGNSQK